jgi:NADH:ubiquinone oxidoreductase subunit 4 (subunit M)
MQKKVFFGKLREELEDVQEANKEIVIASVMLAVITIGVGLFFPAVFYTFAEPVKGLLIK